MLADALRTDRHHFRQVTVAEADLAALRGLVRSDDDLRTSEGRLSNQFQERLRRYYPQLLRTINLFVQKSVDFLFEVVGGW